MSEFLTTKIEVVSMANKETVESKLENILENNVRKSSGYRRKPERQSIHYNEQEDIDHLELFLDSPWTEKRINEGVNNVLRSLFKEWWHERQTWGDWR